MKIDIIDDYCIGCGVCFGIYKELFFLEKGKSYVNDLDEIDIVCLECAAEKCPVNAIRILQKK